MTGKRKATKKSVPPGSSGRKEVIPSKRRKLQKKQDEINGSQNRKCGPETFVSISSKSETWSNLTLLGPYHFLLRSPMKSSLKNRPFFNLIRRLFEGIHENLLRYRNEQLPKTKNRFTVTENRLPTTAEVMEILNKMTRKVFYVNEVDDSSNRTILSFGIYEEDFLESLSLSFTCRNIKLQCGSIDLLKKLKKLSSRYSVTPTPEQLEEAQSSLTRYLLYINEACLLHLFEWKRGKNGKMSMVKLSEQYQRSNHSFYTNQETINKTAHLESFLVSWALDRNKPPVSLWISLPCEEKEHLLESVFDYGLIELFPQELKTFFTQWLLRVRKRMRQLLINGNLRRGAQRVFSGSECNEELSLGDQRVEQFVRETVDNVLNKGDIPIFAGHWQKYTQKLIKEADEKVFGKNPDAQQILTDVANKLHQRFLLNISSCISNKAALAHVLVQLLRFVVILAFNTVGHVFHYDHPTRKLRYDGVFDEEITDFSMFEQDEPKKKVKPSLHTQPQSEEAPLPTAPFPNQVSQVRMGLSKGVKEEESSPQVVSSRNTQFDKHRPIKTFLPMQPSNEIPDFKPAVPPPFYRPPSASFTHPTGIPMNTFQNQVNKVPNFAPEHQKRSFFFNRYPPTPNLNLAPDPIDEELSSARALRTPSVISGSVDQFDEDDEHIPEKWKKAYRLTLEWNKDLKEELERVKARLNMISL